MGATLVVAHGGGPTAVINASLAGVIHEAQGSARIDRILGALWGIEGVLRERFVDLTHISMQDLNRLERTPSSAIGTCRRKLAEGDDSRVLEVLRKNDTGFFLYTGGNDSMDTCAKMARFAGDVRVVGIPKTIDNDLSLTDHCPGFGSAARYYALSTVELGLDVAALNIHVSVLEVMGRNTGWLAAATAVAREIRGEAPHLVCFPERPFIREKFLDDVNHAWKKKRGLVVVTSEGLVDRRGNPLISARHRTARDGFGHVLPGNVSQYLAELISDGLDIRARSEKPGLLARCSKAIVSEIDRKEAYQAGSFAVKTALAGYSGVMVAFRRVSDTPYSIQLQTVDVSEVSNVERTLPDQFINGDGNGVTPEFLDYCRPLVGGQFPDYFELRA